MLTRYVDADYEGVPVPDLFPPLYQASDLVRRSCGVERTRELARVYADKAREVLSVLPDSEAKGALEVLTERVVKRKS